MKRASVSLWFFLLTLFYLSVNAAAAPAPAVSGSDCVVKPGEYVEFPVSISGNTGIGAYQIFVECDTSVFSVDYDTDNEMYAVTTGANFTSGTAVCSAYGVNGAKGWRVTWYCLNGVPADGVLFSLRLRAAASAEADDYPVKISYSEKNTLDGSAQRLALTCVDGSIRVLPSAAALSVQNASAVPGQAFDLAVTVDANPGIAAFLIYIDCDPALFAAEYDAAGACMVRQGEAAAGWTLVCSQNGAAGYQIAGYHVTESARSGTLFTLPLTPSPSVPAGTYGVGIRVSAVNFTNAAGDVIPAEALGGRVSVSPFALTDVSAQYTNGGRTVEASVSAQNGSGQRALLVCAAYTSDGRMADCKAYPIEDGTSFTENSIAMQCGGSETIHTVKVFAVTALGWMPVADAVRLENNC